MPDRIFQRGAVNHEGVHLLACAFAGLVGAIAGAALARQSRPRGIEPNRHTQLAQLNGTPTRRYYTGFNPQRAIAIADLRAMSHKRLPRFALEYLEGGSEDEAAMLRERRAFADWRFMPRTLVDVSALAGLVHGLFLLTCALPLLPFVHPRMASEYHSASAIRQLEPPGFLAMNYGYHTPLSMLFAQIVYGATLGGFVQIAIWMSS
jgi:hypothetical protein